MPLHLKIYGAFANIWLTCFTNKDPNMPQIKGKRIVVTVECTEARKEGKPPSRYMTTKNKSKQPGRIEIKKYNPFLRRHTIHKEVK